jgi:hypothetical protein
MRIFKRDARFYSSLILSVYLSRYNPFTNLLGGNFGATLGQLWGNFGATLGQLWGNFVVILGQLWGNLLPGAT